MTYKWLSFGQNHQEYQRFTLWPKYIKLILPADQSSLVAVVPKNAFLVLWTRFYKPIAQQQESYVEDTALKSDIIENTPLPDEAI